MINFRGKMEKLNAKEDGIRLSKIELQKKLLKTLKWEFNFTNKQICTYVDIACGNFSQYYGGKLLFRDATLYKLIGMLEGKYDK